MSKITRRNLLKQSPSVLALAAVPNIAAGEPLAVQRGVSEDPMLVAAYDRFTAASTEIIAATDALEWLVDEWRHQWPLAPEEILGGANANSSAEPFRHTAERDIAGRYLFRDTSALTKRLTKKERQEEPRLCFHVDTPQHLQKVIAAWEKPVTGKTPKALARNLAEQQRVLAKYRPKVAPAEKYYAEIARLRSVSGVETAKARIENAKAALAKTIIDVGKARASTAEGLRMKAHVLKADGLIESFRGQGGIFESMMFFMEDAIEVCGRAEV